MMTMKVACCPAEELPNSKRAPMVVKSAPLLKSALNFGKTGEIRLQQMSEEKKFRSGLVRLLQASGKAMVRSTSSNSGLWKY
jgi:hypothetical protein